MKNLLTSALFVIALLPFPAFAQSDQKVQLADCTTSGCTCRVTGLSLSEVAATVPITIPDGADNMMLVRRPDGVMGWSGMQPADIDLLYGGNGTCPLQLFDEIMPRDGSWYISDMATDLSRCPMVAMAGMAGGVESSTIAVNWGGQFHPEKLFPEMAGMMDWRQTGRLSWRALVVDEQNDGAFARVTFTARLIDPTTVRGESRFQFNLNSIDGMNLATLLAGGGCLSITSYVAKWRG